MSFDPEKINFFAKTDARGKNVPFGIKARDRQRHMYVIGKTGMGKSTLLENMAIQDIQSGEGVAFIDPHGSTAEKVLEYVPEERIGDVLYFAPFDMEYPVSFNVMEDVGPDKRHLVVSGLMSVFEKIWVDAWSGRMAYILQNTLLALLEYPDATLLGVNRMLSDKQYRDAVVNNITDPSVKAFWVDEFAKYNERYMQEAGDAIKNKIGQFTANPLIRNIIGQPKSSFDIRKIMDEKKILIMNLSKGLVGETNANLLGSMLTTRIYLAAMSRADLEAAERERLPNFYFYVDEFQSFANATFADILSEARKYKLNLIIAHQYIEQMEEEVKNAVFGNVGTIVTFRVGPFDAETLETIFSPKFYATDLCNLGFAQVYLTLMIDGIGSPPFSAVTLEPIAQAHISYKDRIIAESRKVFAHDRAEIEESIKKWHEPIMKNASIGNNGGQQKTKSASNRNGVQRERSKQQGEQQNRSREQNSEKRREERDDKKQSRSNAPAHKDINELRSVLQSISNKDSGVSEKQNTQSKQQSALSTKNVEDSKENDKEENKKEKKSDARGALRDVIQSAVNTQNHSASHTTSESHQAKDQPAKPVQRQGVVSGDGDSAPVAMPQASLASPDTDLTKKQLERMLRVNGQEKPPIR